MGVMLLFGIMAGIFVGVATAGYMFIHPIAERDELIEQQKEENLQVCDENKDLRAEVEDLKDDLSTAYKEIELKDKQIECIRTLLEQNSYNRDDLRIAKIKEVITSANVK